MDDALFTGDVDLATVRTRADLVAMLKLIHSLADKPSVRTLEARTRHSTAPLSKTVVAEMLRGARFPGKAATVSFLRACGVPEAELEAWRRAWERVVADAETQARAKVIPGTSSAPQHLSPTDRRLSPDVTRAQNSPGDPASAAEQTETSQLQNQVNRLMAENDQLRLQLAQKPDGPPLLVTAARDSAASVYVDSQSHFVRYFSIDDEQSERLFYDELEQHIHNAGEEVYILGKGFHNEQRSAIYESLRRVEEDALRRHVDMIRIQTINPVAASWAEGYARLIEEYPGRFRMLADLDGAAYNEVILIDPRGRSPVVVFLFETRGRGLLGPVGRPVFAIFIMNERALASSLADQLVDRANDVLKLDSQVVRDLGAKYTYFAWGVHMAKSKIQRDVPDALPLGKAILREWRRDIQGMLSGPADRATIQHTGDRRDKFDGVAYELSWWGKARIDRTELRAYEEVAVTIELNGRARPAFTYVPLPAATEKDHLAVGSWIALVVEGARENKMTDLLTELRDGGAPIDAMGL
jgi:hypothetical protein